jgi:hypothetical protein
MSKLHDLIDSCEKGYIEAFPGSLEIAIYVEDVVPIMEQYAEYYAKKCLEVAVKNAVTKVYIKPIGKGKRYKEICDGESYNPMETIQKFMVDKNSILNIELPSHD